MSEFLDTEPSLEKAIEITQKLTDNNDFSLSEKEVSSLEKVVQVVKELTNDNNVSELSSQNNTESNKIEEPKKLTDNNGYTLPQTLLNSNSETINIATALRDEFKSGKHKFDKKRKSILIIVRCNDDDKSKNNTRIQNDMVSLESEISALQNSGKFQHVFEYNSENFETHLNSFVKNFEKENCDITFCGLYGNDCVIRAVVLIADELKNEKNNYYFSFMGTRFLKDYLFSTETPSPCNIYKSFKNGAVNFFRKFRIKKVLIDVPYGTLFDDNIYNHNYWIRRYIKGIELNPKSIIKIKILDYKGQPIKDPNNNKKELEVIINNSTSQNGGNKSKKCVERKNRKTRKIKAKKTRKLRVKKPRKRSLR